MSFTDQNSLNLDLADKTQRAWRAMHDLAGQPKKRKDALHSVGTLEERVKPSQRGV
jgi:hypothetical protein